MKLRFLIVPLCAIALISCFKDMHTCGKITDVVVFRQAARKDTVSIRFKVQFKPSDVRSFEEWRNEKKHPDQYWYDLIGTQYCIGDHIPD